MKERQRRKKIIKCLLLGTTLLIMILIPIGINNVVSKQEVEESDYVKEEEGKVSTFLAENRLTISEEDNSSQETTTQAKAVKPKEKTVTTVVTKTTKSQATTTTVVTKATKSQTTTTTVVTKVTKPQTTTSLTVTEAKTTSAGTSKEITIPETSGNFIVKTMNCSAYNLSGTTASGEQTQQWYTIAAGRSYPFGTRVYIPYFKDAPNGGWFVVQDRGSAITDNHLDIYMPSYDDCINFGRRNLEVEIYLPE